MSNYAEVAAAGRILRSLKAERSMPSSVTLREHFETLPSSQAAVDLDYISQAFAAAPVMLTTVIDQGFDVVARLQEIEQRIAKLESVFDVVDELPIEIALERAAAYFDKNAGKSIYPDELAAHLNTSVAQAIELCEKLEKQGRIVGKD